MIAWGVESIPFNVRANLKRYEDLALVIRAIQAKYVKVFKSIWMERNWKFASHKTMRHKEISLFM